MKTRSRSVSVPKFSPIRAPVAALNFFKVGHFRRKGGGRTAHFGLCVALGRSCVGLESCRAGAWRVRAVPALTRHRHRALQALLLPKDDCDRVGGAQCTTESVLRPELGRGVWWVARAGAQGQEILNKMRAGGSQHHFELAPQAGRLPSPLSPILSTEDAQKIKMKT